MSFKQKPLNHDFDVALTAATGASERKTKAKVSEEEKRDDSKNNSNTNWQGLDQTMILDVAHMARIRFSIKSKLSPETFLLIDITKKVRVCA
jgi:hypothetical protein